ncbi:MAG: hypothetical protein GX203_01850 [Acholeplasmataceae bacterium]|nr:hypothetical protein [Acholeplasmataceae bacterium]
MKAKYVKQGLGLLRLIILVLLVGILSACKQDEKEIELSFIKTSYEIYVNEEVEVLLRLKNVKKKDIVFESENPDIATFENGVLKGVSVGKTTISIMIKNKLNTRKYIYVDVIERVDEEYSITYYLDGGKNHPNNPTKYTKEQLPITFYEPTKEHYIFDGWYVNASFTSEKVTQLKTGNDGNIRLYAKWVPATYQINYHVLENARHQNKTSYTIFDLPFNLTSASLSGYIFKGWYLDQEYTNSIDTIDISIVGIRDVYGKFEKAYNITYHLNEGTLPNDAIKIFSKSDLGLKLPIPTKDGYTFLGWYDNPNFTGEAIDTIEEEQDLVLFAKWSGGNQEYPITYNLNKGTLPEDAITKYKENETITLPIPTKEGATFGGWFLDAQLKTYKISEISNGTAGNITLYACWLYEVIFEIEGNDIKEMVIENDKVTKPEDPQKEGHTFDRWVIIVNDVEVEFNFNSPITSNVRIIAKFIENVGNN